MNCTHVNPHRCRTHGTSTRALLRAEAAEHGWEISKTPLADLFKNPQTGEYLLKYWSETDPEWLGAGLAYFESGDAKPEIDRSPLSIVNARRILNRKG